MAADKLTITYPYYDNPGMLFRQHESWSRFPEYLRKRVEIILVDDASPLYPAHKHLPKQRNYELSVYRIMKNVPWNQVAARNLGVKMARHDWVFMTDIDHVLTNEGLVELFRWLDGQGLKDDLYYTVGRINVDASPYKLHPNTYLMHQRLYWKAGGYDEEFSGKVYASDGMFKKRLKLAAFDSVHLDGVIVVRYGREDIADASTTVFKRKGFAEPDVAARVKERFKEKIRKGQPPLVLSFPWEQRI